MVNLLLLTLVVIFAVYSVIISFLYFIKRKDENSTSQSTQGKVEGKIKEIEERLQELNHSPYTEVELKEERKNGYRTESKKE